MTRLFLTSWFFALALSVGRFEASAAIYTTRVGSGFSRPSYVTSPIGDGDRLFVTEHHTGQIKILDLNTGVINPTPFLTVHGLPSNPGDSGLLSMAFHPDYATNGLFYTASNETNFDMVIRQYQVSAGNPDVADATATEVFRIPYGQPSHTGSWIGFNPKINPTDPQYLYVTTGDGSGWYDPGNDAQDLNSWFGKVHRIDVNGDDFPADPNKNYSIPTSNPFYGATPGLDEIWANGLRNPWRASFDRQNGDFYIGDVGQDTWEEINFQPASSAGGENYGWRLQEGFGATPTGGTGGPPPPGNVYPIRAFGLPGPQSVTGGYAYRGSIPQLQGHYFFADFVGGGTGGGTIWSLQHSGTAATTVVTDRVPELVPADVGTLDWISTFGEDGVGELYVVSFGDGWNPSAGTGEIFRIEADPLSPADFNMDGFVDGLDLGILLAQWGQTTTPDMGELDGTPPVDGLDLGLLLGEWNPPPLSSATVPEPSAHVLFAGLIACSVFLRRAR